MTLSNDISDDTYRDEYTKDFVEHWDDLIGWEGREEAENGFFKRLLGVHDVSRILDVASGTGFHAITLARQGFRVTAADGSKNMVRQTQENAKGRGVDLEEVRVADWRELDKSFGENNFDGLICLGNAFTHLFDHEARRDALAAMQRVLKPGGVIILDHRNYDSILDKGFSSKHRYYYTGGEVGVRPVEIARTLVRFRYSFSDGRDFHLSLYPLRQNYMTHLLEDAGFVNILRYGDFEKPYETYGPDFIQQVAYKPGGGEPSDYAS